jgi:uncharacterized protein YjbI with pentapeptide repeats
VERDPEKMRVLMEKAETASRLSCVSLNFGRGRVQREMQPYKDITEFSHRGISLPTILEGHRKWLRGEGEARADLRNASLIGANLENLYLIGADLSRAILIGANLYKVSLVGATLRKASLIGVNLSSADLVGADLRGALLRQANLMGADLRGANLMGCILRRAVLKDAKLGDAVLRDAMLSESNLVCADLKEADLRKADLSGANLVGAHLNQADLQDADLKEATLNGADLSGTDLRGANMKHANLVAADLTEANLEGARLSGANLSDSVLRSCTLVSADLSGARISGVCLDDASLCGWKIQDITCTHILNGGERGEIQRFEPGEFEKKYSAYERTLEMILNIPFTAQAAQAADFIARAVNKHLGSLALELRGAAAVSRKDTKFIYGICDYDFHATKRKAFELELRSILDSYFRNHPIRSAAEERAESGLPEGVKAVWDSKAGVRASGGEDAPAGMERDIEKIVESVFMPS